MALRIPDGYSNWLIDVFNSGGGASSRSSISQGLQLTAPLTQAAVDRCSNIIRDSLKVLYDAGWFIGPVHVVENDSGDMKVWDDVTSEAGTGAAEVYVTPAVATVVSKQSGFLGRSNRGRFYLPGVQEGAVSETGGLTGGYIAAVQAAVNTMQTNLIADAAIDDLVILHDEALGAIGPTNMSGYLVRDTVGTMRPRQRR